MFREQGHGARRLRRLHSGQLQCLAGRFQARQKKLPLDLLAVDVEVAQAVVVNAIARARQNGEIGKILSDDRRGFHGGLDVVDGQHEELGVACAGRFE